MSEAVAVCFPRLGEVDTAVQTALNGRNKRSSGLLLNAEELQLSTGLWVTTAFNTVHFVQSGGSTNRKTSSVKNESES